MLRCCGIGATPLTAFDHYERFRDSDNIVARLNLPNMRYAPGRKLDAYAQAVSGLANLEDDPKKQLKYIDFIDTYGDLDENERASYKREYPQEAKIMMSFSERFIEQGRLEGKLEGKQEGEAMILLRLLQLKFGDVPAAVHRKIERADPQMLLAWSERVLTAAGIEQVISD
ncbi:transposase [Candidatus Thiosymbion oneisti]|uniref:transposase n=1 Tax=Candidatus Thiosymbion oneisti TaxID=589554 RepID=UPI000A4A25C8|nr:transposase [Candidatus Thiosymbion oneisti]